MTFSFAASVILGIVYGVDIKDEHDPLLNMVQNAAKSAELIIAAGGYLGDVSKPFVYGAAPLILATVDYIPLCKTLAYTRCPITDALASETRPCVVPGGKV